MELQYHTGRFKASLRSAHSPTCSQCKWRKVRCDKKKGTCTNCERLGLPCSRADGAPESGLNAVATEAKQGPDTSAEPRSGKPRRLRGPRACVACREKKTRCSGTLPACNGCRRRDVLCTYPPSKRHFRNTSGSHDFGTLTPGPELSIASPTLDSAALPTSVSPPPDLSPPPPPPPQATHFPARPGPEPEPEPDGRHDLEMSSPRPGPSIDLQTALVDFFFESVYAMPSYAFLHPKTTKRRCRAGSKHQDLTLAVCAIAALYAAGVQDSSSQNLAVSRQTTASWVNRAEQSIWMSLECPSNPRLQTLLLVIHYHMETGRFQRAFMLTATAARFAAAMRLNHERPDLEGVPREVRRRILWSLKIVERYFSCGLAEFDLFPLEVIYIHFPSSEDAFKTDEEAQQDLQQIASPVATAPSVPEGCAYGMLVRLESARRDIMKLTRSMAILEKPLPTLGGLLRHHEQVLKEIGAPPPLPGVDNGHSPEPPLRDPWLPRRILAQISWHQAHCDLSRILLPGYPEAAPAVVIQAVDAATLIAAEKTCLYHATRIIHIITALNQNSTRRHLLEFDTAICAYHATRLILFISRFGKDPDRPTPEFAVSRADLCLAAMKRFFPNSALVTPIIRELEQSLKVFSQQQQQGFNQIDKPSRPNHHWRSPNKRSSPPHGKLTVPAEGTANASGHTAAPQQDHDQTDEASGKPQLSDAARARQRLAIHSLLRRADFSDNGDDEDDDVDKDMSAAIPPQQSKASANATLPATDNNNNDNTHAISALSPQTQAQAAAAPAVPSISEALVDHGLGDRRASNATDTMMVETGNGRLTYPVFSPGATNLWDMGSSPSTVGYQEMSGLGPDETAAAAMGDAHSSFFAWWRPQDWTWLHDTYGNVQ